MSIEGKARVRIIISKEDAEVLEDLYLYVEYDVTPERLSHQIIDQLDRNPTFIIEDETL